MKLFKRGVSLLLLAGTGLIITLELFPVFIWVNLSEVELAIENADAIEMRDYESNDLIYRLTDSNDLESVKNAARFYSPWIDLRIVAHGPYRILLLREGKVIVSLQQIISFVRIEGMNADLELKNKEKWDQWFSERQIKIQGSLLP